jgi:GNAT superfamily N-acetyltransferase
MEFRPWIVRRGEASDESWIEKTLAQNWGGAKVIVNDEIVDLLEHMTLIAGERNGLIIFRLVPKPELLFLEALVPNAGVGTALLDAVVEYLRNLGASQLSVTTTNDNLNALSFYQRHGFRLSELRPGAVDRARLLKPTIPLIAENGIPICDELELLVQIRGV